MVYQRLSSKSGPRREQAGFYDSREFGEVRKLEILRCSAGPQVHTSRSQHKPNDDKVVESMGSVGTAIAFAPGPCSMLKVRLSVEALKLVSSFDLPVCLHT